MKRENYHYESLMQFDSAETAPSKKSTWKKLVCKLKEIWAKPEIKIILATLLSRLVLVFIMHWGMDFEGYIEISKELLAGKKLFVDLQTTHMPLVDVINVIMYAINPWKNNIIALRFFLKLPYLLCDIGIALAIMKIIEHKYNNENTDLLQSASEKATNNLPKKKLFAGLFVAFGLPLILQSAGGRYDSLMILCFTMVIYCLQRNDWFGIAFFAALGTSTKYIGIIFLPFVIIWLKKEDFIPVVFGLIIGFLPILPFIITVPEEFIGAFLLRSNHIAYGFSIWHALFIFWNNFEMKFVDGINATYDTSLEPKFIQDSYFGFFVFIYAILFIFYLRKYWYLARTEDINILPTSTLTLFVFIPQFIFALTFKAINIQVLAWFIPYIALKQKKGLLIEYSILTVLHGFGLILFEAYRPDVFADLSHVANSTASPLWTSLVSFAIGITQHISQKIWVALIVFTIFWFNIRTLIEFSFCIKELLKKSTQHAVGNFSYLIAQNERKFFI